VVHNLDIHGTGTNVPRYEVSWNCYDRLITHEMKTGPGGCRITTATRSGRTRRRHECRRHVGDLQLKKNAKFHDGAPVTAKDVKWSLDRAIGVGGFPAFQMSAGSLTKPEQFVVVDDTTVRSILRRKTASPFPTSP